MNRHGTNIVHVGYMEIPDGGSAAGAPKLRIGDDTYITDVDRVNTLGVYGYQNHDRAILQLGSNASSNIQGYGGRVGVGRLPTYGERLEVSGGIYARHLRDSDNTGYYMDPASTSNVNRMLVKYNGGMPTYAYDVATKKYVDSKSGSVSTKTYTIPAVTGYHHFCIIQKVSNMEDSHYISITPYGSPNSESKVRWRLSGHKLWYRKVICFNLF
jgi:hypothetical protein